MRTRVGYCGGKKADPTYRSLGDHTEAFQVDFDPSLISYEDLVALVWREHNPCSRSWGRQYMSAIFVHDGAQRKLAEESLRREAERRGAKIQTPILTLDRFYPAEDYHQKYRLRGAAALMKELAPLYSTESAFREAPLTARLNAFLAGQRSIEALEKDLATLVAEPEVRRKILEAARRSR